ncbi:hypothetical protein [Lysinibacillus sphaericus]|nr:hypothetical protein [Lysinibacillus sphaericus]QPA53116.1 hypothetical protein INQ53_14725 [Lysinibacillus sphaericus]
MAKAFQGFLSIKLIPHFEIFQKEKIRKKKIKEEEKKKWGILYQSLEAEK